MARTQGHHITYEPEWVLGINMLQHRTISRIQITKATPEQYAGLTNFLHAVTFEHNRMRQELDTGLDLRQLKPKGPKKKKGKERVRGKTAAIKKRKIKRRKVK